MTRLSVVFQMQYRRAAVVILATVLLLSSPAALATSQRVALVIGNNAYTDGVLKNPINDARAMASTLRELGFDVRVMENADRTAMQRAVVEFGRKLNENTVGLFYFAGHGMQVRGANYLIPVKAVIESEDEVEVEGVDVAYVMARMATAKNQFNIVILDACRNNPFQRSFRSASNGLAAISAPTGTLIAYATAPGSVASDGDSANGIYTSELVRAIRQPGIPMEEAFKQARGGVVQRTQGKQTPWESSSVIGTFMFKPGSQTASLAAPVAPRDNSAEVALWNAVKDSQDPRDFQAYLDSFPNGIFDRLARVRIAALGDAASKSRAAVPAVAPAAAVPEAKSPPPVAKAPEPTVTASLQPPLGLNTAAPGDYEGMLRQNWSQVEAALKAHWQKEFATYRTITTGMSTTALPLDLKFSKATLNSVDPALRKVVVTVTGQRLEADRYGGSMWVGFVTPFSYALDIVDNRVVIGEYQQASVAAQHSKKDDAKKDEVAVASLKSAPVTSKPGSAFVDTGDLEGTLRQNWPAVEAALKAHVKKEYNTYRTLIPSYSPVTDVRLDKATFERVVDAGAGRIHVQLDGMMQITSSFGANMTTWRTFAAPFAYDVKFVDGKVVIGRYDYRTPPQAAQ